MSGWALLPILAVTACGGARETAGGGTAEILWDTYGVPHVFAGDDAALLYAWGWAQMENHGDLILRLYGRARGRAAEYWGEDGLESDRWVHTVGIPALATEWVAALEPEFRGPYEAFVEGMNAYAVAHPGRLSDDVRAVLPIRLEDPMAHLLQAVHFTFVVSPQAVGAASRRWGAIAASGGSAVAISPPSDRVDLTAPEPVAGSNAWAIAPSRSESGHALLLANPHLPWFDLFTWMEGQLSSPSIDAYGATLVGFPLPAIAFNERLGWTHTVNTFDGADLYELTLDGDGYRFDGETRPFEARTVDLRVRTEDGSRVEPFTVRRSVHGPLVAERAGRALALRVVGLDQPHLWEQYWDMLRARNLGEFETALARLQMPMFTVMYADADGHIMHVFGGRTPVRPEGKYDWSGIVPGDRSETLWTEVHPYAELPRVLDPESGWLQNANDPPWTTTFPRALDPAAFPSYMAPRGMAFRPQRSARMLAADTSISFEEMVAYKHSTRMELADRVLDDLLPAARAEGGDAARAAEVLDAWDRTADADSRGGVLFRAWWNAYAERMAGAPGPFATPWDPGRPLGTPDGLADVPAAVEMLSAAARSVKADHGALDVPWGEVNRLRRDGEDLPSNGASGAYGVFRVTGYREAEDGKRVAAQGDSYVAAIEFGPRIRAWTLIGYGNASQPGSPHRTDQLEHYAEKSLRPVWRTEDEVREHLETAETLRRPPLGAGGR